MVTTFPSDVPPELITAPFSVNVMSLPDWVAGVRSLLLTVFMLAELTSSDVTESVIGAETLSVEVLSPELTAALEQPVFIDIAIEQRAASVLKLDLILGSPY